jgi:hypothetical protein
VGRLRSRLVTWPKAVQKPIRQATAVGGTASLPPCGPHGDRQSPLRFCNIFPSFDITTKIYEP